MSRDVPVITQGARVTLAEALGTAGQLDPIGVIASFGDTGGRFDSPLDQGDLLELASLAVF